MIILHVLLIFFAGVISTLKVCTWIHDNKSKPKTRNFEIWSDDKCRSIYIEKTEANKAVRPYELRKTASNFLKSTNSIRIERDLSKLLLYIENCKQQHKLTRSHTLGNREH